MKYNHIIFTFFFSSILLQGFSQNHSYKDLYGLWLNPDRYTKLGMSEDINLGDKSSPKYFESRRSLYIDPIEISYIEGGFEKSSTDDDSKDIQNAESSFRIKGRTTIYRYGKDLPLNDTLIVHVKNTSRNLEPETIKVVFLNANTAYFKFATQDFVKLSRDIEPDLMDHIYQFGIDEFFPEGTFSNYFPKVESSNRIPTSFTQKHGHFFRNADVDPGYGPLEKLVIFEEEIHDGLSIWPVVKTFQFENYLVVLTKNQNPKSEYYLSTYRYYIFIESGQQLSFHVENQFAKSKKSIILEPAELLIPEKDFSISLDDLARSYFTTYYFKPGRKLLDYAPLYHPLELTENGDIHIDGQHFQFVRAYKNFGLTARIGGKDTIMFEGEELILDENPFNIYANYIFELQDKEKRFLFWYTGKSLGGPQIHFNHPNTFPYRETRFRQDHATSQNKFIPLQQLLFIYFYESLIILIPLLIAIFILYRTIILPRRLKNRLTALQFEGIKSQLNPHFLFNSMASIQSLMNQRKAKEANRYLNELSDLLRYHLDTGAEELVPLSEELSAIEHYCELEKLRSPFELNFEIDQGIDPDRLEIPNQLLQPIVENAIKHGLRKVDDPKLRIRVQQLEKSFSILIEDNGPGIGSKEKVVSNQLPTSRKTHKGMGLVQEKISLLKKRGIKVKFAIEDRQKDLEEMESGTKVNIELPLNY